MLELTKTPLTDGRIAVSVIVPAERMGRVEMALEEALDSYHSIKEVFPDLGPGDALRGARGLAGLTQAKLAEAAGVHKSHISEMERGVRPIGKEMAKRLGKALNMPYKVFL